MSSHPAHLLGSVYSFHPFYNFSKQWDLCQFISAGMNLFSMHTETGTLPSCWWTWKLVQLADVRNQKLEHVYPLTWGFQVSKFILRKSLLKYSKISL